MIKFSKSQREQLIAVAVGAVAVIACLWYAVVLAQNKQLKAAEANCVKMRNTLKVGYDKVRQADVVEAEMARNLEALKQREAGLAPEREPFSWMAEVLRNFWSPGNDIHHYKTVTIADIKPPEISDKGVITGFPYKWAKFHITGEGHYHDFGKFIADFENAFPFFRIENLEIGVPSLRKDPDMLAFNFDIVTPQVPSAAETK